MKTKIILAVVILTTFAPGAKTVSSYYIHIERPVGYLGELGVYCSNGSDPTVIGMEEKYLIVSCGTR